MTLSGLKSTPNLKNLVLLSYDEIWTKSVLNFALKSGILNSDTNVFIAAFVSHFCVACVDAL